jgi:uncharacterized membrane protein
MEMSMNVLLSMLAMIIFPVIIATIEGRIQAKRSRTFLEDRLMIAVQTELDPELASTWLNRLALRARLHEYGSR